MIYNVFDKFLVVFVFFVLKFIWVVNLIYVLLIWNWIGLFVLLKLYYMYMLFEFEEERMLCWWECVFDGYVEFIECEKLCF